MLYRLQVRPAPSTIPTKWLLFVVVLLYLSSVTRVEAMPARQGLVDQGIRAYLTSPEAKAAYPGFVQKLKLEKEDFKRLLRNIPSMKPQADYILGGSLTGRLNNATRLERLMDTIVMQRDEVIGNVMDYMADDDSMGNIYRSLINHFDQYQREVAEREEEREEGRAPHRARSPTPLPTAPQLQPTFSYQPQPPAYQPQPPAYQPAAYGWGASQQPHPSQLHPAGKVPMGEQHYPQSTHMQYQLDNPHSHLTMHMQQPAAVPEDEQPMQIEPSPRPVPRPRTKVPSGPSGQSAPVSGQIRVSGYIQVPAAAPVASGEGLTGMVGMVTSSLDQAKIKRQKHLGLFQQAADQTDWDLGAIRKALTPAATGFLSRLSSESDWPMLGVALLHVGATYDDFFDLMRQKKKARKGWVQNRVSRVPGMSVNLFMKYCALMHSANALDSLLMDAITSKGVSVDSMVEKIDEAFKTQRTLMDIGGNIETFLSVSSSHFGNVSVTDPSRMLRFMEVQENPAQEGRIQDFSKFIAYLDFTLGPRKGSTYIRLVELLAEATSHVDFEEDEITIGNIVKSGQAKAEDAIHEEGLKGQFLAILSHHGTEEQKVAVVVASGGKMVPSEVFGSHRESRGTSTVERKGVGIRFSRPGMAAGLQGGRTGEIEGSHHTGFYDDQTRIARVAGEIHFNSWKHVGRTAGVDNEEVMELGRSNALLEAKIQMMMAVRRIHGLNAESVLVQALRENQCGMALNKGGWDTGK